MIAASSPRPVWFGQKTTDIEGIRIDEKSSPATPPE
jgi:hypothetical protein